MKIKCIYNESTNLEDMSKDRFELNLSWNEWNKIECFINSVIIFTQDSKLRKKAQNLNNMIRNAKRISEWENKGEE